MGYGCFCRRRPKIFGIEKRVKEVSSTEIVISNEDIKARVETEKHISSVSAEKEIVKIFDDLKKYLLTTDGLMLSGNPLSKEAIESLIETLSYAIKVAKIINGN